MRSVSKFMLCLCAMCAAALLIVSLAQAQAATQPAEPAAMVAPPVPAATVSPAVTESPAATPEAAGSGTQLVLRRPLLGLQLMQPGDAPNYFQGSTLGGGDLLINLGGDCAVGYSNALANVGVVWLGDSGAVEIGFNATKPAIPTAIIMWDVMQKQWWCDHTFKQGNYLQFDNMPQGIYYIWTLTQISQAVEGDVFVRAGVAS
ncbi:MAG TPA: hypothetical protein VHD90_14360 [Phototrophicaceae bacterium]|nr:hypothetical protein [Phototrophicaceae bacterium]